MIQKAFIMVAVCNSAISSTMEAVCTIDSLHDLNERNLPSPDCQNVLELALLCLKDLGADHPTGCLHDALNYSKPWSMIKYDMTYLWGAVSTPLLTRKTNQLRLLRSDCWKHTTYALRDGTVAVHHTWPWEHHRMFVSQSAFSQILKP